MLDINQVFEDYLLSIHLSIYHMSIHPSITNPSIYLILLCNVASDQKLATSSVLKNDKKMNFCCIIHSVILCYGSPSKLIYPESNFINILKNISRRLKKSRERSTTSYMAL